VTGARVRWSEVDPLIRGPFPAPEREREFEVDAGAARLGVGRLISGDAWPAGLPRMDRLAALPLVAAYAWGEEPETATVLAGEFQDGQRFPLCVAGEQGPVRWVVDPASWIGQILSELYVGEWARPLPSRIPLLNYARLPHAVKGAAERLLSGLPSPELAPFPELPLDTLVDELRRLCGILAGGRADPCAGLWPDGRRAALTLTHDVDTGWILDPQRRGLLREILDRELALGFAGAWYVVGARVDPSRHAGALETIREAGHEVGVHGWNHDAKLGFLDEDAQERRLARAAERLEGLGVEGIRTPWYWRSPGLFEVLGRRFVYDSSVPTASGLYGTVTRTGCCSVFPYAPRPGLLELPLTLPPDTALALDERVPTWNAVAERIIELGGVIVPILHPQPRQLAGEAGLAAWFEFLGDLSRRHRSRLWSATPAAITRRYAAAVQAA
jgi:hypothetical protein